MQSFRKFYPIKTVQLNSFHFQKKPGRIHRRDFKNVIDGFCSRTTDTQFSKLIAILDPKGKGYVSYHEFFKLFDESLANVNISVIRKLCTQNFPTIENLA